ncbi:50S ribosomal protein L25 [Acidimicrobiaceae bacterium]|jgi:large subunit ribosomal protein L25|nr:50S ribosomal protein L25 [Acidimicrobiaceae bacterium]|tara:strand:- start:4073 stop:4753 length:681 start_codon:yes stop_codon:yes gene_type:complete
MEANLKATLRESIGSGESRRLRNEGFLPAVIYGLGMDPVSIAVNAREFTNALKTDAGSNVILNLEVGKSKYTTLAREIQRHPYKNEFLHIDLIQIDLTQNVEANVQVNFLGTPIGVKDEGGLVQTINSTITVSTLPSTIPASLDLDISELNVGENATVLDVKLPEGVELATEDDDSILVTITLPRAAIEEEEIDGLEGEGLEGEEGAEGESSEETAGEESSDESGE